MITDKKLRSKPSIYHGKIDNRYFVIAIFDDQDIIFPMKCGLVKFFQEWDKQMLDKKIRKEEDHAYFPLSTGSSSGCVR